MILRSDEVVVSLLLVLALLQAVLSGPRHDVFA
jgi:hypothetical protein